MSVDICYLYRPIAIYWFEPCLKKHLNSAETDAQHIHRFNTTKLLLMPLASNFNSHFVIILHCNKPFIQESSAMPRLGLNLKSKPTKLIAEPEPNLMVLFLSSHQIPKSHKKKGMIPLISNASLPLAYRTWNC